MYLVEKEIKDLLEAALSTSFKEYRIGKVFRPYLNELPILTVYGTNTTLVSNQLTTASDKWLYNITVELIQNAYNFVDPAGVEADDLLDAQNSVKILMEDRNTDGQPKITSVLGVLRDTENMRGTNYLFNNETNVEYTNEIEEGKIIIRGILTLEAYSTYGTRIS